MNKIIDTKSEHLWVEVINLLKDSRGWKMGNSDFNFLGFFNEDHGFSLYSVRTFPYIEPYLVLNINNKDVRIPKKYSRRIYKGMKQLKKKLRMRKKANYILNEIKSTRMAYELICNYYYFMLDQRPHGIVDNELINWLDENMTGNYCWESEGTSEVIWRAKMWFEKEDDRLKVILKWS